MKTKMIAEIEGLEGRIDELREKNRVNKRGELLFHSPISMWSEKDVAVEADGEGGALLMIVEGNYPADFTTHREQRFRREDDACEAAERMIKDPLEKCA